MDLYKYNSRRKVYLAILGCFVILVSFLYTNYIALKLKQEEKAKVELILISLQEIAEDKLSSKEEFIIPQQIIKRNKTIPLILLNDTGQIEAGVNFGEDKNSDLEYLATELEEIKLNGEPPIEGFAQKIYYKESRLLTLLRYYPLFQFVLIGSFIIIGYLIFNSSRRAEQNQVWVGMAKETAHQLGTPISAIVGWLEHLKMTESENEDVMEVVVEMDKDVNRLELIAQRFSKIGSKPELKEESLNAVVIKIKDYMEKRSPRKVFFHFENPQPEKIVKLNAPLFEWVLENLIRNALDAMEGKGDISFHLSEKNNETILEITDTGSGMTTSQVKNAFKPGFSTKKRGWGLGLSLSKRIIENYHSGKIFIKSSQQNIGTTFTIKLPKA